MDLIDRLSAIAEQPGGREDGDERLDAVAGPGGIDLLGHHFKIIRIDVVLVEAEGDQQRLEVGGDGLGGEAEGGEELVLDLVETGTIGLEVGPEREAQCTRRLILKLR